MSLIVGPPGRSPVGFPAAASDPYPIIGSESDYVLYLDSRHGLTYDGSNVVSDWASRVGSITYSAGTGPTYSATGSGTSGPRVNFAAASSQYLLSSASAIMSVFNGQDKAFTVCCRGAAAMDSCLLWACDNQWGDPYVAITQLFNMFYVQRYIAPDMANVNGSSWTSEEFVAVRCTGTAAQVYCDGWGSESAFTNTNAMSNVNVSAIGAKYHHSGGVIETFLDGGIVALSLSATALSTSQIDTIRTGWASL